MLVILIQKCSFSISDQSIFKTFSNFVSPTAMLQEAIDKTEGAEGAAEEKRELEELKQLLPEIAEKVEDAKESQRTASAASEAIHQTLVIDLYIFIYTHTPLCISEEKMAKSKSD